MPKSGERRSSRVRTANAERDVVVLRGAARSPTARLRADPCGGGDEMQHSAPAWWTKPRGRLNPRGVPGRAERATKATAKAAPCGRNAAPVRRNRANAAPTASKHHQRERTATHGENRFVEQHPSRRDRPTQGETAAGILAQVRQSATSARRRGRAGERPAPRRARQDRAPIVAPPPGSGPRAGSAGRDKRREDNEGRRARRFAGSEERTRRGGGGFAQFAFNRAPPVEGLLAGPEGESRVDLWCPQTRAPPTLCNAGFKRGREKRMRHAVAAGVDLCRHLVDLCQAASRTDHRAGTPARASR